MPGLHIKYSIPNQCYEYETTGNDAGPWTKLPLNNNVTHGQWQGVPYNAANFSCPGGMTITGSAGIIGANEYTLIGRTLIWNFVGGPFTLGGTPSNAIFMVIPAGISPRVVQMNGQIHNGGWVTSLNTVSGASIIIYKMDISNYALGNLYIAFQMAFPF